MNTQKNSYFAVIKSKENKMDSLGSFVTKKEALEVLIKDFLHEIAANYVVEDNELAFFKRNIKKQTVITDYADYYLNKKKGEATLNTTFISFGWQIFEIEN